MGIFWRTFQYMNLMDVVVLELFGFFLLHYAYHQDSWFDFWQHYKVIRKRRHAEVTLINPLKLKQFEAKSNLFAKAAVALKCFSLWAPQSDGVKAICVRTATSWLQQEVCGGARKGRGRDETLPLPRALQNRRASPCLLCPVSLIAFICATCWHRSQVYLEEVLHTSSLALKAKQLQSAL